MEHQTYQKYGVPSQELKLLFCVELQKEENWDFKFLLQIILLSCIRFICVLILIELRSCANGNMSNKSNLLILLIRYACVQVYQNRTNILLHIIVDLHNSFKRRSIFYENEGECWNITLMMKRKHHEIWGAWEAWLH